MSKIFYDHLVVLQEIEVEINSSAGSPEEKEELWRLVDEIIHHKVLGRILDALPVEHHEEFLNKFHDAPHDERLLSYLNDKSEKDMEKLISEEVQNLKKELLSEIKGRK